jgi:hypothetical protein
MIKKEYYRLDELNKRFDITYDEVRYSVESGSLKLAFHVSNEKFVIGRIHLTKGLIASGIASYSGLVSISDNEQLELIKNDSIKSRQFTLLQKSNITQLESEYPFESSIPNALLAEWKPKSLEQIIFGTVSATICPKEQKNALKTAGQSFLKVLADIGKKPENDVKVDTSIYDKFPDFQFLFKDIELTQKDICVLYQDLELLGIVNEATNPVKKFEVKSHPVSEKASRTNDFHDLLKRILREQPSLSAKKIWIILEKECDLPNGERQYDEHNILRDIFDGEIYWISIHQNENYFKFSSLAATLSKLKMHLRNESCENDS